MKDQSVGELVQALRVMRVSTPLGDSILLAEKANILEAVNEMFEIEISVRAKRDIRPEELIGKAVSLEIEVESSEEGLDSAYRPFNGVVTELHEGPAMSRGLRSYSVILRPQLWLLSQTRESRIWMDMTTMDVLDTLMKEHGLPHADVVGIIHPVPAIHYSTQFNESDLDYLLRRIEQDGLFWFFRHEQGTHRLVVANHPMGWQKPLEGRSRVRIAAGSSDRSHIHEWTRRFAYVPGKRTGADWNYKTFRAIPLDTTPSLVSLPGNDRREVFDWPAYSMTSQEIEQAQKLRMQASEADHERVSGSSDVRILESGRRFMPYDEANPDARHEEHVIVKAMHEVVNRSFETTSSLPEYRNSFEAIPARVPLTPHRTTHRPRIAGLQVAVVAGPEGEEIHCDANGCVKLWFPWQRHRAKKDGSDTKWIRTAQNWAGSGWGGQIIPRVGMEVMVAFIDGDPDRPLVVGAVPNPANRVPYDLPLNKTKSVFRTQTHKGNGFNEISFEDDLGHEEIFIHAQRDKLEMVSNRSFEIVGDSYDGIISGIRSMSSISLNPALQKGMKSLLERALEAPRERNKTRR